MDRLYREVTFPFADGVAKKINYQLRYKSIARRVESLHLELALPVDCGLRRVPQYRKRLQQSIKAFSNLKNLSQVSIQADPELPIEQFAPLLEAVARVLDGKVLQMLSVSVPLLQFRHILLMFKKPLWFWNKGVFIREMHITFSKEQRPGGGTDTSPTPTDILRAFGDDVLPFILGQRNSLEALSLKLLDPELEYFFIHCIGDLALHNLHLSKLAIEGRLLVETTMLAAFLGSQKSTLKHLVLKPNKGRWIEQDQSWLSNVLQSAGDLPNLQILEASFRPPSPDTEYSTEYKLPLPEKHQITSLILGATSFLPNEAEFMLRHISKSLPSLEHLSIAVIYLTPRVLDAFAFHLPNLKVFHLMIGSFGPHWPVVWNEETIRLVQERTRFPTHNLIHTRKWHSLEGFRLSHLCRVCLRVYPVEDAELLNALKLCIPVAVNLAPRECDNLCTCFIHL